MKLFKIIIVLFLIVIGAYTAFWYNKSNELKNVFKTHIDQLAQNKSNNLHLEYSSIERGGYPFHFSLALINPKITEIKSGENANNLVREVKIDGKIIDHFSLSGQLQSVEYTGKANVFIPPNDGEQSSNFLVEGNMLLESKSGNLIPVSFLENLTTIDQLFDMWEHINLDNSLLQISNLKISDVQRNIPVLNLDSFDIHIDHKPKDETNQLIKLQNSMKGFDLHTLVTYIYSLEKDPALLKKLQEQFTLALSSKEGKSGYNFDLDLDIPNKEELQKILKGSFSKYLTHPLPKISIAFKGSSQEGAFGTSNLNVHFATNSEENKRESISFKIDATADYKKNYVEALAYAIEKIGKEAVALNPKDEQERIVKELLVNHTSDLIGLVPKMNEFGTIQETFDLNIKVNKSKLYAQIALANFDLLSNHYGIKMHGKGEGSLGSSKGLLTLDGLQYESLIRDLTTYSNKVIRVVNLTDFKVNEISKDSEEKVLNYIRAISNEPQTSSKDVHITARFLNEKVKVGTLSLEEFIQKTENLVTEIDRELRSERNLSDN